MNDPEYYPCPEQIALDHVHAIAEALRAWGNGGATIQEISDVAILPVWNVTKHLTANPNIFIAHGDLWSLKHAP